MQVSESGKALLDVLQRCPGSESDESAPKPDFTAATHAIMGVLHQVMQVRLSWTGLQKHTTQTDGGADVELFLFGQGHHEVEGAWQHRKLRLHQRLQLCVFQQDVRQV